MDLSHVTIPAPGGLDAFLAAIAARLQAEGVALAGCVQANTARPGRCRCDMALRVLPDGPVIRISEDRGEGARGCRLDSGALEEAVALVARRLTGAEILILNRFGKREAEGRGLVPVIAEALAQGLPVLVGLGEANRAAFEQFAGGLAQPLPADSAAVLDWCRARRRTHAL